MRITKDNVDALTNKIICEYHPTFILTEYEVYNTKNDDVYLLCGAYNDDIIPFCVTKDELINELEILLIPKDENDDKDIIKLHEWR